MVCAYVFFIVSVAVEGLLSQPILRLSESVWAVAPSCIKDFLANGHNMLCHDIIPCSMYYLL